MTGSYVSLTSVSFGYNHIQVLNDFTVKMRAESATAVVGANGCGKSTVLGLIAGVLKPSAGTVDCASEVALAPQHSQVAESFPITVAEVVAMGRWRKLGLLRPMTTDDRRIVDHWIRTLGLDPLRRRRIGELSGGQRQRALVAQAFAQQAPVVALDEPTTGMDDASKKQVINAIRELVATGHTVVVATHDPDLARACDHTVALP
ncbi:zinc ABC transporter ATP-binding protein AztA [Mycobacterium sp. MS1601]|uniref:zinc ABC transporter ATP-binding protein AztA n=1 Tax=Mycobacterium sp. MS1601 TaxID=1936029 RepID=UPI001F015784|nr:zinc ABC transporter ATP-binding protein AztA [Mycobacterium sp. MS1601]